MCEGKIHDQRCNFAKAKFCYEEVLTLENNTNVAAFNELVLLKAKIGDYEITQIKPRS